MPDRIIWRSRRGILVPVAVKPAEPAAPPKSRFDIARFPQMIACPTCHAKVSEMCRTKTTGRTREPHANRIIPKRCQCGEVLGFNQKLCCTCRAAARRENGRVGMRNTRARRKAAA